MGVNLGSLGNDGIAYRNNIYEVGRLMMFRLMRPWIYFNFFYSLFGYRKELDEVLEPVLSFTKSIIEDRKKKSATAMKSNSLNVDNSTENVYF